MEAPDRCEIRITGPFTREASHNYFHVEVVVNVLFVSHYEESKNQYAIIQKMGVFHEAMDGPIAVLSTETSPETTSTRWSAASSRSRAATTRIRVLHFGQVDPTDRLKQSMVDARYRMELFTNQ